MSEQEKVVIKVRDNGSILVTGDVELVDNDGNAYETKKAFSLCRCGESHRKPFCDGSHKDCGFESSPRVSSS